jgi:polysaccharide chain length determinant protein (PEP-CTERM system associated)
MRDTISEVIAHARGAWRYRWQALIFAWTIALGGWAMILLMPPVYVAHARVYVDTESVLKPLLNGLAVNTDPEARVSMMARVMMGRPNLERVARETDLSLRARTAEEFETLVTLLGKKVSLEAGGGHGANVYSLSYADADPVMAQRVVQRLLDAFMEDTLGIKRADSGSAQQFLVQQIHDYEGRLSDAEARLAEFKQRNVGVMPGQGGDYYTRLQTELAKLEELQGKYRLALEARSELNKQLEGEEPTFGLYTGTDASGAPADPQIAEYRRQLDQLLLQYTDKHPKVIALKATIAQLEAQKAASAKQRPALPVPKDRTEAAALALDMNPVYQNLRLERSRTDVSIATLRQQILDEERVTSELKARVNTIPQTEAQLAQLTRDYEITKSEHQALVQRLNSARLSDQAEESNSPVKFRVIEPPIRPLLPEGPKRVLLMTVALLAAIAGALGLGLLLDQLRPVFLSRSMLASITGLPVLGAISYATPRMARRSLLREPVLLATAGAALLVAYLVGIGVVESASRLARVLVG